MFRLGVLFSDTRDPMRIVGTEGCNISDEMPTNDIPCDSFGPHFETKDAVGFLGTGIIDKRERNLLDQLWEILPYWLQAYI
jgi:hypothetical protein